MKSLLVSARLARPETFAILRTKYFTLVGLSEWGDTGMSSLHKVEVCHGTYTFNKNRRRAVSAVAGPAAWKSLPLRSVTFLLTVFAGT